MAGPSFSGVRLPADWRRKSIGVALILLGLGGVWMAVDTFVEAWTTSQEYQASDESAALARQAVEPTPIFVAPATPEPLPADLAAVPAPLVSAPPAAAEPTQTRSASADQLSLDSADFRFLDPPEPGAHARVAISVANHADVPSGRILLGIPASWFDSYAIIGSAPAVSEDRTTDEGMRTFSFPPVAPNTSATYELHVTASVEGTTPPKLRVLLESGDAIGEAAPSTVAPTPRPGPVMAIDIPRLKLHTGVLQAEWEAPPFAIGQIKRTAHITEGNTVLIGHLTGAAGNVFAHLDQLQLGDDVTAVSRGVSYSFVVSRIFTSSNTDTKPIDPTTDSRLTLMTCAGVWNPFTHDYSERLWVIAEPPDQAAATIASSSATATVVAAATATASVEATATPVATPTAFVGEPSLAGGLGNSRTDVGAALGVPVGETADKLVVFRQPGREYHVLFTPDPARAALLVELPQAGSRLTLEVAMQDARRLLPRDAVLRSAQPDGSPQFVVERFSSASVEAALGTADIAAIYMRGQNNSIASVVLGLGEDFGALIEQSRR